MCCRCRYKGTAITLVDAFFTVSSNAPVGDVPLFWVTTESQLYPYGAVTKVSACVQAPFASRSLPACI